MAYTAIDDGSEYFHVQLYTGNGSDDRNITNDANAGNFKPDWLWIKQRDATRAPMVVDSNRGANQRLRPDSVAAEDTKDDHVQSFLTDGFQVGTNNTTNVSGGSYVAYQWKANGGSTSSNSDGDITATVQANTTAGFSIITYSGTGSGASIGHGLGVKPAWITVKRRNSATGWPVQHHQMTASPESAYVYLEGNGGLVTSSNTFWNGNAPTTSLFYVASHGDVNASGGTYVAYVFAEKQGYSKFGKYTGNGNNDGPFVYTGFRPAYLLVRNMNSGSDGWAVFDSKKDPHNGVQFYEFTNNTAAEGSGTVRLDFLSNGFKLRQSGSSWNEDSQTIIYSAFAEHPFVSSNGVPITAR